MFAPYHACGVASADSPSDRAGPRPAGPTCAGSGHRSILRKLNPLAKSRRGVTAYQPRADRYRLSGGATRKMARRKLTPSEIVERLQAIDAFTADGQPMAVALRAAGVLQVEYDQ